MKKIIYLGAVLFIALAECKKSSSPDIVFQDSLASNANGWLVDTAANYSRAFINGTYQITTDTPESLYFSPAPFSGITYPYTIQVHAQTALQNTTGSNSGSATIIFNYSDLNDYDRVEVWSNGYYRIVDKTNGNFTTVQDFTTSTAIKQGNATNIIEIIQNANTMQLVINGATISPTFAIALPTPGVTAGLGVSGAVAANYTPTTISYSNFEIIKN